MTLLEKTVIISLIVCFIILFLNKTGWLLKYEAYRPYWLPAGTCYFCLGWWMSLFISVEIFLVTFRIENFAIPFLAAPLINFVMMSSTK